MDKIKRYGNWCEWDCLDGHQLLDGEKLKVRWPSGLVQNIEIKVKSSHYMTCDMGHDYQINVTKAYAKVTHTVYGVDVEIPLLGVSAERVHAAKGKKLNKAYIR